MDQPPHIVVVKDEAAQRQLLADYLARQNFRTTGVGDGAALRRLFERESGARHARCRAAGRGRLCPLALAARAERPGRHHHGDGRRG
jgi:CheY-like chemotaxis protein